MEGIGFAVVSEDAERAPASMGKRPPEELMTTHKN